MSLHKKWPKEPYNNLLFDLIDGFEFFLFVNSSFELSSPASRGDNCLFPALCVSYTLLNGTATWVLYIKRTTENRLTHPNQLISPHFAVYQCQGLGGNFLVPVAHWPRTLFSAESKKSLKLPFGLTNIILK